MWRPSLPIFWRANLRHASSAPARYRSPSPLSSMKNWNGHRLEPQGVASASEPSNMACARRSLPRPCGVLICFRSCLPQTCRQCQKCEGSYHVNSATSEARGNGELLGTSESKAHSPLHPCLLGTGSRRSGGNARPLGCRQVKVGELDQPQARTDQMLLQPALDQWHQAFIHSVALPTLLRPDAWVL